MVDWWLLVIATNVLQLPEGRDFENEIINLKIKLC
jgi:hypothetical protein